MYTIVSMFFSGYSGGDSGGITETYERAHVCNYGYFLLRAPGKDFEIDSIFKELTIHEHIYVSVFIYMYKLDYSLNQS